MRQAAKFDSHIRPPNFKLCVDKKGFFNILSRPIKTEQEVAGGRGKLETKLSSFHEFQSEICKMLAPLACAYFVLNIRCSVMLLNNQRFKKRHG